MWKRAISGSGGGGGNGTIFTFAAGEMAGATDSNPIRLEGNFTGAYLLTYGYYASSTPTKTGSQTVVNAALDTWLSIWTGGSGTGYNGWRHVKILSTGGILIGSGGYDNITSGGYGAIIALAVI